MITTAIVALMLTQAPVPTAPAAPAAPSAPSASASAPTTQEELRRDRPAEEPWKDLADKLANDAKRFELDAKAKLESKEFKLKMREMAERIQQEILLEQDVFGVQMRDKARQERDKSRQQRQDRRRIPEGWVESTEPFSRTFKVTKGAALMLANIGGTIQVSPGGNDQIDVQAIKHAWGPNAEQAKQRLGDFTIEVYATGNRVELRVEQAQAGRRDGRGVDVEFDVKVPADTAVELRTVSGDIRVTNVRGEVRVQGVSGNLALDGTPRLAAAKTVSGDITLTKAGSDGQLSLSTVSGNLLMQTLTTRALDLNTVSGDIKIGGWSGERAMIRTLSGDLDLQTSLTKGGRYDLESHSGNIQLAMPEQSGFDLDANTFSGRIRIDFPIKSEGPIRDSARGPRSVRGTYGDASSSLRVQTFSGDLTVIRR